MSLEISFIITKNISLKTLVAHGLAMVMGHCSDLVTGVMGTHLSNSIHTLDTHTGSRGQCRNLNNLGNCH